MGFTEKCCRVKRERIRRKRDKNDSLTELKELMTPEYESEEEISFG